MIAEITVSELLSSLSKLLSSKLDTARIDVEVLMAKALDWQRSQLYARGDHILSDEQQGQIASLINRRLKGEPIAYITGEQEFWSLLFKVTPATLIPRPETEHLVEEALRIVPPDKPWRILDLGTGSGAIALSIARERPVSQVIAVDRSEQAISVARENQRRLNLSNVEISLSDWFQNLEISAFDLIVSNPPYVAENDPHLHTGDIVFEPKTALSSGLDGLSDLKAIISNAPRFLKSGGWLLVEHGFQQADQVKKLMQENNLHNITSVKDLAGHPRITFAQS